MKENEYSVYKHTFPNGKVYIGITSVNPIKRWGHNGHGYHCQPLIFNAICKYGWVNIKHEVLYYGISKELAEQEEIRLIAFYDSTDRNKGYNIENGGKCIGTISKETRKQIAEKNKGKKRTIETRKKISKALKGRTISDEQKKKQSIAMTGRVLTMGQRKHISESTKGRKLSDIAKVHIAAAKMGNKNPMYGKHFNDEAVKKLQESLHTKEVLQIDDDGKVISKWDSIRTASKETNIQSKNIYRSCVSNKLKAGGYKWQYSFPS